MTKTELVELIAEKAEISKAEAGRVLAAFEEAVTEGLVKEGKVSLVGFLTLEKKERAEQYEALLVNKKYLNIALGIIAIFIIYIIYSLITDLI